MPFIATDREFKSTFMLPAFRPVYIKLLGLSVYLFSFNDTTLSDFIFCDVSNSKIKVLTVRGKK